MKSKHDHARPTTPLAYLANRERRLRCALACKAKLGVFIPQQGDATPEAGQEHITRALHQTINYRGVVLKGAKPVKDDYRMHNLCSAMRSAQRRPDGSLRLTMEQRMKDTDVRTRMTLRRWMRRLGYLPERADYAEEKRRVAARFKDADDYLWRTTKDLTLGESGVCLLAGTRVYWDDGSFYTGHGSDCPSITLRGADIDRAGVSRGSYE